ncbi:hypothetical protein H7X68_01215 [Candidatus Saccharibacteria bacterium]|nr:hypothetical protein [Candidatus Saccharibacteria bacterium]
MSKASLLATTAETVFDVMSLEPGQTLKVETDKDTWWITASSDLRSYHPDSKRVWGVSLQTNSAGLKANSVNPKDPCDTRVDHFVTVGDPLVTSLGQSLGVVTSFKAP